jgi:signal transduction histidine kinase
LRNVLKNAIEHSGAGDTVEVTLNAVGGAAEVRVSDHGPGIPAADLDHVFDRFYRADAARSRDAGGSGLGLAIARWIIEQHKGSVTAASAPGEGTTITIAVPLAAR